MDKKAKFLLDDEITFTIHETTFHVVIIGIIATKNGIFYDVSVNDKLYRSIEEESIKLK